MVKLTEADWQWQKMDPSGLQVDENLGENPIEIAEKWLHTFHMESGAKKTPNWGPLGAWGQQKRRKRLLDPRFEWLKSGLKVA